MASRDGDPDRRLRKTSIAWSYFTLVDEEKHIASCNTCDAHMSFRSSISNLMKHMKRKHGDIEPRMSDEEKASESEAEDTNKIQLTDTGDEEVKVQSTTVWDHFEITNAEKKTATCSICSVPLSFKNNIRVLVKHLRRKHNMGDDDDDDVVTDDEDKKEDNVPPNLRSAIWPYFRITDTGAKAAQCLVCKKLLSYNTGTSNLRKHLRRKHPLIKLPGPGEERKTIILSSGDQLYEFETSKGDDDDDGDGVQDSEPVAIDEVFLDEFNGSINRIEKTYKPRKRKHKERERKILEPSDSEDELIFKKKYVKKPQDSVDLFAKYIASLLRELPKHVSNQLQKDFVRQIINAQNECQSTSNNAYAITITNSHTVPDDVSFEVIAKDESVNK